MAQPSPVPSCESLPSRDDGAPLDVDTRLVASAITGDRPLATAIGCIVFAMFAAFWFAFPQWRAAQSRRRRR